MEAEELQSKTDGSRIWLPIVIECIAHSLPANEVACTLRLVDKSTSLLLEGFNTVRLSLPSPLESFTQRWGRPGAFRGLTRKQRLKLLCLTAASGSIANLEVALDNAGLLVTGELLEAAVEAGQLEACKLLRERGCPWGDSMAAAAKGGHRHMCEWLLASGCPCCLDAVYAAARGGHEGLMHWLLQLFRESHAAEDVSVWGLLQGVAAGFNLPTLHQQLLAGQQQQQGGDEVQPPPVPIQEQQSSILAAAAGSLTPDWQAKVQWLEGLGYPRTTESGVLAAGCTGGDDTVSRLQWLHSRGYPLDGRVADSVAGQGNLAALRFLIEQAGVRPTSDALWLVALEGHLDVLQYLHASGVPMDAANVACYAAFYGHLPVVAWTVESLAVNPGNAPDLLSSAAASGNIGLMTWLLERGWTIWNKNATSKAAASGCEEALEWMVARGCPWQTGGYPYVEAAPHSDLAMIRCLQRLGCPWGPNQLTDCISWAVPVPILRCFVELGCPVDWDAVAAAAEVHRPGEYRAAVLSWLGEERRRRQQQ